MAPNCTGVWYEANAERGALADHLRGVLGARADQLATSMPVLAELWSLLAVRRSVALATATCLDVAAHTDVLAVTPEDRQRALGILRRWSDQSFSYTDATSFAVMTREGIETVLTLDDHFRVYRHGRRRDRAFHVLD